MNTIKFLLIVLTFGSLNNAMMQKIREKVRFAVIEEIKSKAWQVAVEEGVERVTVNGIARYMGITPPAFYSYFKSRDELIMALVIDSYRSFRESLIAARDSVPDSEPDRQIYCVFMAYRQWALTNKNMFRLFVGRPVPGLEDQESEVIQEAEKVYDVFINLYETAWQQGVIKSLPKRSDFPDRYILEIQRVLNRRNLTFSKEIFNLTFRNALLVHGMISMELSGRFSTDPEYSHMFYKFQVIDMLRELGIEISPANDVTQTG